MHPDKRVELRVAALAKAQSAARRLSERYDVEKEREALIQAIENPRTYGDAELTELFRLIAIADVLDALARKTDAPVSDPGIAELPGVGEELAAELEEAGITTREHLLSSSDEDLLAVPGVGPARLKKIRQGLN